VSAIEQLENEVRQLEAEITRGGLDPAAKMAYRERLAYTSARLADLEARADYAEISSDDLQRQLEEAELRREELYPQMKAAVGDRHSRPALARKLERAYQELAQHEAGLRTEVSNRAWSEANALGFKQNAERTAEREVREADAEALAGLEDFQRPMAEHKLAASFDARVAKHAEAVEAGLWQRAEKMIGAQMIGGPGAVPTEIPTEEE
jgi:hypothetical protein